jgi:hypothetical protein
MMHAFSAPMPNRKLWLSFTLVAASLTTTLFVLEPAGAQQISLKQVTIVVLSKGPHWTDADTPEHNDLQRRHANYRLQLANEGTVVAAGPIEADVLGAEHRGFSLFIDKTEEEIARLNAADPKIAAGHLKYHLIKWHIPSSTYEDLMALVAKRRQAQKARAWLPKPQAATGP